MNQRDHGLSPSSTTPASVPTSSETSLWTYDDSSNLDVVYICRAGLDNEELRYSLRSLANLPHRRVWIVGGWPHWLNTRTVYTRYQQQTTGIWSKHSNGIRNSSLACETDQISDPFVLMHDDMYVMRSMPGVPRLHRGLQTEVIADYRCREVSSAYVAGMVETLAILEYYKCPQILCYELHVPLLVRKREWLEGRDLAARIRRPEIQCLHQRTFYGNYYGLGGVKTRDFKVVTDDLLPSQLGRPFLSTEDTIWHLKPTRARGLGRRLERSQTARYIMDYFPGRSQYELKGPATA